MTSTTMTVPAASHHQLAQAAVVGENLIGTNDAQRFLLANRTVETDSLIEDLLVTRDALAELVGSERADTLLAGPFSRLRQIIELNDAEGRGERAIVGALHSLAAAARGGERSGDPRAALSIRGLRSALRPHLAVVADRDATRAEVYRAIVAIDDIVRHVPTDRLVNGSLSKQLGDGPHRLLLDLLGHEAT